VATDHDAWRVNEFLPHKFHNVYKPERILKREGKFDQILHFGFYYIDEIFSDRLIHSIRVLVNFYS